MARIGYARVSSKDQNLERQLGKLESCQKLFTDKQSGGTLERPGFKELMSFIREGDVVVVTEIARLGRNNEELTYTMDQIRLTGATLEVLNFPTLQGIENANLRRLLNGLMLEIYKYQAESERESIRENQRQGIEIAKQKGLYKGRKPRFNRQSPQLNLAFDLYETGNYTVREIQRMTGIPESTFRRYKKKYKIEKGSKANG